MIKISPSILASDFANLESEIKRMEQAKADMLHIDVMDGHFVPNLTLGAPIVKSLRKKTDLFFDVHLMISDPLFFIDDFADAGADLITFHVESDSDPKQTIQKIKSRNIKAGISVKPKTPASEILDFIDDIDMVLIMTVEPGFGGQSFMSDMMPKIEQIKQYCEQTGREIDIQVDGGITIETAPVVKKAGANVLVAGSFIFSATDPNAAVAGLRDA
ncbi:MAG: rpe [Oscillospiraceae bacterium]|nr:rpe [Oscillospiraceae bacterium]